MRFFFILILLAGMALGVAYPWALNNFSGDEIGTWRVFERGAGFEPVNVNLSASDEPVRILVDLTAIGAPRFAVDRAVLTMTVSSNNRTVLAEALNYSRAQPRETAPQAIDRIFRADAGPLTKIADGQYTFAFGMGDAEGIDARYVDLTLRRSALVVDQRAQPIGLSMIAIGVIGMVLASRRRRETNPNSQPPQPKWGRGGNTTP